MVNYALLTKAFRLFFTFINAVISVLLMSIGFNHMLNSGSSLVATGIPLFGLITLPGLPNFVAFIVGFLVAYTGLKMLVSVFIPRDEIRKLKPWKAQ